MGTSGIVRVFDETRCQIVQIYAQSDGYPDGLGEDLRRACGDLVLVNGLSGDTSKVSNGMGCFAAALVAQLKNGAGQFYLQPFELPKWAEYVYDIRPSGEGHHPIGERRHVMLEAFSSRRDALVLLWSGRLSAFDAAAASKADQALAGEDE